MNKINHYRIFKRNKKEINLKGNYVLYWMQINRRFHYNFALEYAVAQANELKKPLLIYEGLKCDYPWACDRFHQFILEGMKEHQELAKVQNWNYYPYVESKPHEGKGLLAELCRQACIVVSDEFPAFIIPKQNRIVAQQSLVSYITIDSNGIIPLGVTKKASYSAYIFRKTMQTHFLEAYQNPPKKDPMKSLMQQNKCSLPKGINKRWPKAVLKNITGLVAQIPIDHTVLSIESKGTRSAALKGMKQFIAQRLWDYGEMRNHPDADQTSGLSPYLHFGKISTFEIVKAVFARQPENWALNKITPAKGISKGFFKGLETIDAFLDELITWREVGYHFCHHTPNYDQFDSLPDWAKKTLTDHEKDPRDYVYELAELEKAQTHDDIWNAAQNQLVSEGVIQNYLRMLWAKNILAWTPNPKIALYYLIELNNKYSIDGRNPNSYSGIFWSLGRFDRAWGPERQVFGKVRYMTSESARRKFKMANYLNKFSEG